MLPFVVQARAENEMSDAVVEACEDVAAERRDACRREAEAQMAEQRASAIAVAEDYLLPVAEELAKTGDARSLALAAGLRGYALAVTATDAQEHDARATAWQRQALSHDGGDAMVAILVLTDRLDPQDPLRIDALRRWRTLEPGNLAPVLLARTDEAGIFRLAHQMRRFDARFVEVMRLMLGIVERHPPSAQMLETLHTIGGSDADRMALTIATNLSMTVIPSFSPLLSACISRALPPDSERRHDCRRFGEVLAESSDTEIAVMIGLSILRYNAGDADARAQTATRRRVLRWQLRQWQTLRECFPPSAGKPKFSDILRAHPGLGEQALIREHLIAGGMAVEPPADWAEESAGEVSCDGVAE